MRPKDKNPCDHENSSKGLEEIKSLRLLNDNVHGPYLTLRLFLCLRSLSVRKNIRGVQKLGRYRIRTCDPYRVKVML